MFKNSRTFARVVTPATLVVLSLTSPASSMAAVLSIQAENASQTIGSGWINEKSLRGYEGSGYIVWRGANDFRTSNSEPPAGIKAYDFIVSQPGTYKFVARVQARVGNGNAASDKDNDAWVKFTSGSPTKNVRGDSAKWTKFYTSGSDESWKNYSRGEQYGPTFFTDIHRDLSAGTHRVLIGGRSARFAIDSVGLELLRASGNIEAVVASPVVPTTPVVVQPTVPAQPAAPTPSTPESGACTASGDNLAAAKRNYAKACPTIKRADCDPVSKYGWLCSSVKFGANASSQPTVQPAQPVAPVLPAQTVQPVQPATPSQPTQPTSTATACTADGSSIGMAKSKFASNCAGLKRVDCDPIGGGRWRCSSGVIGKSAPNLPAAPRPVTIQQSTPVIAPAQPTITTPAQPTTPAPVQPSTPTPVQNAANVGRISRSDLLALHYDNCPDRDDGHAIASGKAVIESAGLRNIIVVNGTCGAAIRNRYQPSSVNVLRAVWGNDWLDAYNNESASVAAAAQRWASTLANGDDVWVAEGGPSDFTAKVLRRIGDIYPSVNRKKVRVIQHSAGSDGWNEKNTSRNGIALVKSVADYREIPDGNVRNNGSADLNKKSSFFVNVARQSRYASEWSAAFNYLSPDQKLDFSDTVEILYIIDDSQTKTVDDFANRYLK